MKRTFRIGLSGILAALMIMPAAPVVTEATVAQSEPAEVSAGKGLFYEGGSNPEEIETMLDFADGSGFDRIYYAPFEDSQPDKPSLPSFIREDHSAEALENLSSLSRQLAQRGLSLTLSLEPYLLASWHPAYPFVKNAADNGCDIASMRGGKLYLNPSWGENTFIAQWNLQRVLAAADHTDELLLLDSAFFDFFGSDPQANTQPAQAQRMAAYLEQISASGLAVSVAYGSDWAPYASGILPAGQTGLLPQTLLEHRLAQAVYPTWATPVMGNLSVYEETLTRWIGLSGELTVIPRMNAGNGDVDPFGLFSCLYLNRQMGLTSVAVGGYEAYLNGSDSANTAAVFATLLAEDVSLIPTGFSLQYPQRFSITRPEYEITITGSSYYVMGTSDPSLPVYCNGEEIMRETKNGCFGLHLTDIPIGTNTYVFSQGGQTETVTITRPEPDDTTAARITRIVQSSIYPYYSEGVAVGEEIPLKCTAPAGARVTATFQGRTVSLTQRAIAQQGVPAVFSGTMVMESAGPADETTLAGPITYTLNYNGAVSTYTSTGEMYAVGEEAALAVMANDYINNVYGDVSIEDDFYMTLYAGACDYVAETTDTHYKLASGGYLPKSTADLLAGKPTVDNRVSSVRFETDEKTESIVLTGTANPPYRGEMTDTQLIVTLWNTSGVPSDLSPEGSELFEDISISQNEDGSVTFTLSLLDGAKLWGYNVEYDGENTVIYAKKAPILTNNSEKPLEGIVVVVDAGHGGEDPGALGVAGTSGPTERELNFITAYASAQLLEALGAEVHMVSEDNSRLDYEGRMDPARTLRADFFLSFHHNSTAESTDSSGHFGMEVYYHEPQSQAFAEQMLDSVTSANSRRAREAYQSYYRVTRMTYAPSLLLELGFVVNPAEYEDLCQPLRIYQTALGVADGIYKTIKQFS